MRETQLQGFPESPRRPARDDSVGYAGSGVASETVVIASHFVAKPSRGSPLILAALLICIAAAAVATVPTAHAQQYPTKPIRIVVPFPPGGFSDVFARVIGARMT